MRVHHLNGAMLAPRIGDQAVCHLLLIELSQRLVLVDAGLGRADLQNPGERLGRAFAWFMRPDAQLSAVSQVERLGFAASDVSDVVMTHLDLDHSGGLPDFPRARVHVSQCEFEAMSRPRHLSEHLRYRRAHFRHRPRWELYAPGHDTWMGVSGAQALRGLEGCLLVPLPGHTRGHAGVAVPGPQGWLLHAGDGYFRRADLTGQSPDWPVRLYEWADRIHPKAHRDSLAHLRRLAAMPSLTLVCSHDTAELAYQQDPITPPPITRSPS